MQVKILIFLLLLFFCDSDKEEDCHEYDATTAEELDGEDNRRGGKRKREEDFLYEMDEADGLVAEGEYSSPIFCTLHSMKHIQSVSLVNT